MGRYLELAQEALADLKHGKAKLPQTVGSPDQAYDINDQNDKRVSDADSPPWADPDNPDVQAARQEAERLGVPGYEATGSRQQATGCRWLTGSALAGLAEPLQGLVCPREGWTAESWAAYLERRAALCDERHRDLATLYAQAARMLARNRRTK